ncbi:TPA: hypothetical protein HA325_04275 [Candidatus Thalassarchaeaceae archaeon]|nr:MAG TPA: hypothetical protein D7I15_04265 [Candidatus Poseidoniales archaeon]HII43811.1 hypothetical protein [Candidatus Thalassarchaeaceae archaeon]
MVDVDSALRASAYSGKKRARGSDVDKEEKKSRKIEPFEPSDALEKEKADAFSMWLVIALGLSVGLLMRYVLMPTLTEPEKILWVLPLMLVVLLPTLHRLIIPDKWSDRYDRGNWFRASFLYIFTWLAISFLLVNPPLADIAPPTLAGGIDIAETEGVVDVAWTGGTYTIELNQNTVDVTLGMAVSDNVDSASATIVVSHWFHGAMVEELANGTVSEQTDHIATFADVEAWERLDKSGNSKVIGHAEDIGVAWDLGTMGPGEHQIKIKLVEEGDPWAQNVWERTYTIVIIQVATA